MEKTSFQKTANSPSRRNLPAEERRRELLEAAIDLFSEKGTGITVQELADRVNVTQPLVHRYFPTKSDLIAAIRDSIQNAHWDPQWREVIKDRGRPLEDRIVAFYSAYLPTIHRARWLRGFWFSALEDPAFARDYTGHVEDELLTSIAEEARMVLGYASLENAPLFDREMELVWGLHSAVGFVGVRKHVYQSKVSEDFLMVVRDQVRGYLAMAPQVLSELMPK